MAGDLGYSWQPGAQSARGPSGSKVPGATPQQAVRILSLRIPERVSPTAIAPLPLLTSKGSAAAGASGLDSLVAALIGMTKPPTSAGTAPQVPVSGMGPMGGGAVSSPTMPPFAPDVPILRGPAGPGAPPVSGPQPVPVPRDDDNARGLFEIPRDPDRPRPPMGPTGSFAGDAPPAMPMPGPPPNNPSPPPNNTRPPSVTFPGPRPDPDPSPDPGPSRPSPIPVPSPGDEPGGIDVSPPGLFDEHPTPPDIQQYLPDYKRGLFEDYGWF